jgi:hypothetical protein
MKGCECGPRTSQIKKDLKIIVRCFWIALTFICQSHVLHSKDLLRREISSWDGGTTFSRMKSLTNDTHQHNLYQDLVTELLRKHQDIHMNDSQQNDTNQDLPWIGTKTLSWMILCRMTCIIMTWIQTLGRMLSEISVEMVPCHSPERQSEEWHTSEWLKQDIGQNA